MDEAMSVGLKDEIIAELTVELQNQPTFNADILAIKVRDAYRKVRSRKCYENTSFSEEQIEKDLYNRYYQDIKDVAKYNFATMGADFQISHSENNISRTWRTEEEVMSNIVAYVGAI
ncbi:MAG: hypothetical protein II291_01200 [Succinivibrio sp.]|nr:hypothetical protein [Succinivibrio sp.]